MKKRVKKNQIGLKKSHQQSLVRNQITSLVINQEVTTTLAKAKLLKKEFDRFMTRMYGKNTSLETKKRISKSFLYSKEAYSILWQKLIPKFEDKKTKSGFTTIYQVGNRAGDKALLAKVAIIKAKNDLEPKAEVKPTKKQKQPKNKIKPSKNNAKDKKK